MAFTNVNSFYLRFLVFQSCTFYTVMNGGILVMSFFDYRLLRTIVKIELEHSIAHGWGGRA